jgi:hypothetical protein
MSVNTLGVGAAEEVAKLDTSANSSAPSVVDVSVFVRAIAYKAEMICARCVDRCHMCGQSGILYQLHADEAARSAQCKSAYSVELQARGWVPMHR